MGAVYEAYDARLERRVAIKVIQAERSDQEVSRARFRREALAAAALKDAAIVHVYDVVGFGDQDCIVMELVEGETLRDVFEKRSLGEPDVAELGAALAGGLAEAHGKGIIHRDLKADNVMLLSNGQAKILDFGLAKYASGRQATSLSVDGQLLGTPYAMSPEQTRGETVDHRSDLFSLGVLLYNALTGINPFQGNNITETVARIQTQRQRPARVVNPKVSEELSEFLDRLLAKTARDRPRSASEVRSFFRRLVGRRNPDDRVSHPESEPEKVVPPAHELERTIGDEATTLSSATISDTVREEVARQLEFQQTRTVDRRRSPRAVWMLVAIPLIVLAILMSLFMRRGERPSVAVLGIESAGPSALGSALSQLLIQELRLGGTIRVAEGQVVARRLRELGVESLEGLRREDFRRLGETLGVDYLIWGSHERLGEEVNNISVQMEEAESGIRRLEQAEPALRELQLGDFIERAGQKFRRELNAAEATQRQLSLARRVLPEDLEAARLYALALEQFADFEFAASIRSYEAALKIAPDHPMLWAGAAEVWSSLGENDKAKAAIEQAKEMSLGLPKVGALEIEARACELGRQWDCAIAGYRSLFEQFPDDLGYGVQLGNVQVTASRLDQAEETIGQLRQSGSKVSPDPRIDRLEARVAYFRGDYPRSARLAQSAADMARKRGEWLLLADIRRMEATVLDRLGDQPEEVQKAQEEARDLFQRFGDTLGLAKTLERMATFYFYRDPGLSLSLFEQARETYLRAGAPVLAIGASLKISKLQAIRGDLSLALVGLEAALPYIHSWVDSDDPPKDLSQADPIIDLGYIYHQRGDLAAAEKCYLKAKEFFLELENPTYLGASLSNLGELAFLKGELEVSKRLYEEALAKKHESGDTSAAYERFRIARIYVAQGLYRSAREELVKALESFGPGTSYVGETHLALAELSLLEGQASAGLDSVLQAEEIFTTFGQVDLARLAVSWRATLLLALGKLEEVRFLVQSLGEAMTSENPQVRLAAAVALARFDGSADGSPTKAGEASLRRLQEMIQEVTEAGFVGDALAARLAVFEIRAGTDGVSPSQDLPDLEKLIEEARAVGFEGTARRGQHLLLASR